MKDFISIDLVVVLMEKFCFHRPDCCLMENSASMDLVVILWKVSVSMDLIVVLWKKIFITIDLIVIL